MTELESILMDTTAYLATALSQRRGALYEAGRELGQHRQPAWHTPLPGLPGAVLTVSIAAGTLLADAMAEADAQQRALERARERAEAEAKAEERAEAEAEAKADTKADAKAEAEAEARRKAHRR